MSSPMYCATQSLCRFLPVVAAVLTGPLVFAGPLNRVLAPVHPEVRRWATVIRVHSPQSSPAFQTFHYDDSKDSVAFWPASTIKVYTVVAVLEWLNEHHLPLEATFTFSHQNDSGEWVVDCARTVPEMVSEVFRRSSNEDYTLLLRALGIDHINTQFLIPENGFPHSALMRDYVTHRPVVYVNEEPQRLHVSTPAGLAKTFYHQWSGTSYAAQRGATALSSTTGNCTSTAELAECLKKILFHDRLPSRERYNLTSEQAHWISQGDPARGIVGLENRLAGPYAWQESGERVFPKSRFFHKAGLISNYVLDVAYLADAATNTYLILALAAHTGDEQVIRDMAHAVYLGSRSGVL